MEKAQTIVEGTRVHRTLLDEHVTFEDWEKADKELRETSEVRLAKLKEFKEMLANNADFLYRTEDIYLLRFLRSRKFDLQGAFKLIRGHYKFRAKYPLVFPAPSTIEKAMRENIFNYLPHRDHMGRAIFLVKMGLWDPDIVPYQDFVAVGNILSEFVLDNPVTQINGYIGLWDFKGFSFKQFVPFCSPKNIHLLQCLMQDRFPGRFKIAYCVNCHYLFNTGWSIVKPILKEKYKSRIKIVGSDMNVLHQFIHPSILPKEYGGNMPAWDCEDIVKRVLDKEQYFNYNRKFGFTNCNS